MRLRPITAKKTSVFRLKFAQKSVYISVAVFLLLLLLLLLSSSTVLCAAATFSGRFKSVVSGRPLEKERIAVSLIEPTL